MLLRLLQGNHALSSHSRIALLTWTRGQSTKPIEYKPIKKLMIANRGKLLLLLVDFGWFSSVSDSLGKAFYHHLG